MVFFSEKVQQEEALDLGFGPVQVVFMTTTISVTAKGQLALPRDLCERIKIKPGVAVRVTEVADGLYVTPIPEPTEKEMRHVIAAAGSLLHPQTAEEEEMVRKTIGDCRAEKRRKLR